jgi:hypothetical protein
MTVLLCIIDTFLIAVCAGVTWVLCRAIRGGKRRAAQRHATAYSEIGIDVAHEPTDPRTDGMRYDITRVMLPPASDRGAPHLHLVRIKADGAFEAHLGADSDKINAR